ncbi:hypothetical protein ACLB2K_048141 [Fragaria x ananassa]
MVVFTEKGKSETYSGMLEEDATWEPAKAIMARFRQFGSRGRLASQGGGIDAIGDISVVDEIAESVFLQA